MLFPPPFNLILRASKALEPSASSSPEHREEKPLSLIQITTIMRYSVPTNNGFLEYTLIKYTDGKNTSSTELVGNYNRERVENYVKSFEQNLLNKLKKK